MYDFLPIGSIVKLEKDELFEFMIIGYLPIDKDYNTQYDYCGVVYPQGLCYGDNMILFNKDEIEIVKYQGFTDEDSSTILTNLFKQLKE